MTSNSLPRVLAVGAGLLLAVGACTSSGSPAASGGTGASWTPDATLLAAAKAEGQLTTIALPHNWCDYGDLLTNFKAKTGLTINELNPDGGSGDEVNAIKQNQSGGQNAPDVIDVGLSFGPQSVTDGIIAPYKVSTWDSIPDSAKDKDGNWYGDYYGVMAFEVNTTVVKNVPKDWSDLQKPEYKNSVGLAGDPTVSNQAISAVWAAGLATGGSLDNAQPGLDFFKQLNAAGNFVPVIGKTATVASGETPIRLAWTYNALADNDALKGTPPLTVVVPTSGRFGGLYVQAISKYAPHPNAAKLWEEYIYSDEGQITYMKGYCTPARYDDLKKRNVIPADIAAKLPDTTGAVLPSLDQINKATDLITKGWASSVGATVK